jgi:hypothetical protein
MAYRHFLTAAPIYGVPCKTGTLAKSGISYQIPANEEFFFFFKKPLDLFFYFW